MRRNRNTPTPVALVAPVGRRPSDPLLMFIRQAVRASVSGIGLTPVQISAHVHQRMSMVERLDQSEAAALILRDLPNTLFVAA